MQQLSAHSARTRGGRSCTSDCLLVAYSTFFVPQNRFFLQLPSDSDMYEDDTDDSIFCQLDPTDCPPLSAAANVIDNTGDAKTDSDGEGQSANLLSFTQLPLCILACTSVCMILILYIILLRYVMRWCKRCAINQLDA